MGTIYVTHPIDSNTSEWLRELGVEVPSRPSRSPKQKEIEAAISTLPDVVIKSIEPEEKALRYFLERKSGQWTELKLNPFGNEYADFNFINGDEDFVGLAIA